MTGTEPLDRRARDLLTRWTLRADGPAHSGATSVWWPVRTEEGGAAVLTVRDPHASDDARLEHLVLRRWGGDGAVRLLRADPREGAVLTERLRDRSLATVDEREACTIIAGLYRRLHVPAMPQLDSLRARLADEAEALAQLPRNTAIPHRLVEQARALARELSAQSGADVVLHGDLHRATVLAADRAPWLAVSPRPVNGAPPWEVAPLLWGSWSGLGDNVRDGVRRRFFTVVDAAGFDEEQARAWTIVRTVRTARMLATSRSGSATTPLTRLLAVVKAVQD